MMAILYKSVSKKNSDALRAEDKQMLETYGKVVDFTDEKSIKPIVVYVKIYN